MDGSCLTSAQAVQISGEKRLGTTEVEDRTSKQANKHCHTWDTELVAVVFKTEVEAASHLPKVGVPGLLGMLTCFFLSY